MNEETEALNQDVLPTKKLETPEEIVQKYRQSVQTAEQLKKEILEGLDDGTPTGELLLKAARIVSLLTDNPNFAQLCEKHLKEEDPE